MSSNEPTSSNELLIRNISDTARWVAAYRATETERPDALFHDPYARRLAGEKGAEIAEAMPFKGKNMWPFTMRTYLMDELIDRADPAGRRHGDQSCRRAGHQALPDEFACVAQMGGD